jgi:hypothetical protein
MNEEGDRIMNGLHLIVDDSVRLQNQTIDVTTGRVQQESASAGELCKKYGLRYLPMTPALKSLVLFTRKDKNGDANGNGVTLGDFGPFVLARIENGKLVNQFRGSDFCKPMKLSSESVIALAEIFGGARSKVDA